MMPLSKVFMLFIRRRMPIIRLERCWRRQGRKQLRIAETEKYAHVTFFFSGGREETFTNEDRTLIPSPKVATYDLQPEMSAYQVKDAVIKAIETEKYDFICLNFANGDMVGHTGIYEAIMKGGDNSG